MSSPSCLVVVLGVAALAGPARADESEALSSPIEPHPGTLDLFAAGSVAFSRTDFQPASSAPLQSADHGGSGAPGESVDQAFGIELRGRYWHTSALAIDLEIGRPRPDDRLGHGDDWETYRARLSARYAARWTAEGNFAEIRGIGGITVPLEALTSPPDAVGIGGSAALAVGINELELFGFGTISRPGTTGAHASIGPGMTLRLRELTFSASGWVSQTQAYGSTDEHVQLGAQATLAHRLRGRWLGYVTGGGMSSPRTYAVGPGLSARRAVVSFAVGLQRRFDGPDFGVP